MGGEGGREGAETRKGGKDDEVRASKDHGWQTWSRHGHGMAWVTAWSRHGMASARHGRRPDSGVHSMTAWCMRTGAYPPRTPPRPARPRAPHAPAPSTPPRPAHTRCARVRDGGSPGFGFGWVGRASSVPHAGMQVDDATARLRQNPLAGHAGRSQPLFGGHQAGLDSSVRAISAPMRNGTKPPLGAGYVDNKVGRVLQNLHR